LTGLGLDTRDILQINATIIAGSLIFLTLIGITPTVKSIVSVPVILTLLTVIFFSFSSLVALQGSKNGALDLMKAGFIIIIMFALIIILLPTTKDIIERLFFSPSNQTITNQNVSNQTIVNQTIIG